MIGTIQQICFTCVFNIQSNRWWHQMCSLKAEVENREGGLRWPPERECWLIYQKGCDLTISKIRVGADHRGGVAIPDWTNHSRSHTQEAAVLVNSTKWGVWPYRFYGLVQRGLFQLQLTFLILVKVISTLRGEREMKRDKEDEKLEQSKHSL